MNGAHEFWAAVDTSAGPDQCWPWTKSVTRARGGYGQLTWMGRKGQRAHRIAYELAIGAIPPGFTLDHVCHHPDTCVRPCLHTRCCNPEHLEVVSLSENVSRRGLGSFCGNGHPKTSDHGRVRSGRKWRCVTCELEWQRNRRMSGAA